MLEAFFATLGVVAAGIVLVVAFIVFLFIIGCVITLRQWWKYHESRWTVPAENQHWQSASDSSKSWRIASVTAHTIALESWGGGGRWTVYDTPEEFAARRKRYWLYVD